MASTSDRTLFLEMIKTKPMTINDIINNFGVARNTARNWVRHDMVTEVDGSWPPLYIHKGIDRPEHYIAPTPKVEDNSKIVRLYDVSEAELSSAYDMLIEDHPATRFEFSKEFRALDSENDAIRLEAQLITSIMMVRYFRKRFIENRMD